MKTPSEMTGEVLANHVLAVCSTLAKSKPIAIETLTEAASRLRNTTPRTTPPNIEEVGDEEECWVYNVKKKQWRVMSGYNTRGDVGGVLDGCDGWIQDHSAWLPLSAIPTPQGEG